MEEEQKDALFFRLFTKTKVLQCNHYVLCHGISFSELISYGNCFSNSSVSEKRHENHHRKQNLFTVFQEKLLPP